MSIAQPPCCDGQHIRSICGKAKKKRYFVATRQLHPDLWMPETTGSPAASHAARPPAISMRLVMPCWCRMLTAIDDLYPPAQCTAILRLQGTYEILSCK